MLKVNEMYDLSHSIAGEYLSGFEYPWQALGGIKALILSLGPQLGEGYREVSPTVWVHETATVAPTAFLGAPCKELPVAGRCKTDHCNAVPFHKGKCKASACR